MSIPGSVNPLFLGAAGQATGGGEYQIERSVRFNSPDSAYLSRTPGTAGNRRTFTWAAWVKRSGFGGYEKLFSTWAANTATQSLTIDFLNDDTLNVTIPGTYLRRTTQVFRDPSAWYHILVAVDTTLATAGDRVKVYVNGSQVTQFSITNNPAQNDDTGVNQTATHAIGAQINSGSFNDFFNGYLADIHFIDGQSLDPSSFTEVSATTGQLIPKAYAGTYTGNSFWLKFNDNSAATAATLGKDSFLLGNNWTPNNLSVTAGAGNDSLVDTPTSYGTPDTGVGGEIRGNYATLNPLDKGSSVSLANGNLNATITTSDHMVRGTMAMPASGKWYFEFTPTVIFGTRSPSVGIANNTLSPTANNGYYSASAWTVSCGSNPNKQHNNTETSYASAFAANDVGMCAVDLDNGKIWWGKNGTWFASGNPATGTNAAFTDVSGTVFPAVYGPDASTNCTCVFNWGQRAFAYTAPSGFKALCDTNLPTPVVAKPSSLFDAKIYSGNGTSSGSTQAITGLGFSPDLVWIKARSVLAGHALYDVIRGTNSRLSSSQTNAEFTGEGFFNSFDSTGFTVAGNGNNTNATGETYVAWTWDAGTTTASNPDGSITSQVRANVSAGFSIVTWTGNGTAGATVGHGLGVAPGLIIVKQRIAGPGSDLYNWNSYHSSLGATKYIALNKTDAAATAPLFNDTAPTSSVFSLGSSSGTYNNVNNASAVTYVAYCFAPVSGYSSALAWTGNGSADGPLLNCGFSPRFFIAKRTDSANDWWMWDTARSNTGNPVDEWLSPNRSDAEYPNDADFDFLSNGIKIRTTSSTVNASAGTYIGFAWAENPFQYARGR